MTQILLSILDTWVLREAKRVFADAIESEQGEEMIDDLLADYGASTEPPAGTDAALHRWRELTDARKALEEAAEHYRSEAAKLEKDLVESFAANGTQSVNRDGRLFYLQRSLSASVKKEFKEAAVEAARGLGLDYLIVLQPQSLAAYARAMRDEEGGKIPAELEPLLNVFEETRLRMRGAM